MPTSTATHPTAQTPCNSRWLGVRIFVRELLVGGHEPPPIGCFYSDHSAGLGCPKHISSETLGIWSHAATPVSLRRSQLRSLGAAWKPAVRASPTPLGSRNGRGMSVGINSKVVGGHIRGILSTQRATNSNSPHICTLNQGCSAGSLESAPVLLLPGGEFLTPSHG